MSLFKFCMTYIIKGSQGKGTKVNMETLYCIEEIVNFTSNFDNCVSQSVWIVIKIPITETMLNTT